jgi:hypothetical protein
MSSCIRMSSPKRHSSSLAVRSSGVCTSSSSLRLLRVVFVELARVAPASLPPRLLLLCLFLNQPLLLFVLVASVSDITDEAYSEPLWRVLFALELDRALVIVSEVESRLEGVAVEGSVLS